MAFGFNNKPLRKSSIGGDFDGDGVKNRKDCQPFNFKKQGGAHEAKKDPAMYGLPEEARGWSIKTIKKVLEETGGEY